HLETHHHPPSTQSTPDMCTQMAALSPIPPFLSITNTRQAPDNQPDRQLAWGHPKTNLTDVATDSLLGNTRKPARPTACLGTPDNQPDRKLPWHHPITNTNDTMPDRTRPHAHPTPPLTPPL